MKSLDQGFVKACDAKVAEVPLENWDLLGAKVIRDMSAQLTKIKEAIKEAERQLYYVCFQVVVESESLQEKELEALNSEYDNLKESLQCLNLEQQRLEERKENYAKFSSGLNPARYAPKITFR